MANGNFVVQNGLTIGPLTIDATTGSISTTGNITTTGTTTTFINEIVTGTEAVYGLLTANAGIASTSSTTGTFVVTGGVGVSGAINTGANISIGGTSPGFITAAGSNKDLIIDPDGAGNIILSGVTRINYATVSSSTTSGALQVTGGVGIGGALYVGSTISAPTIGNTGATLTGTLSTATQNSVTTLAGLTSFGTAGINTTAQGNLTVAGNLVVNGNITTTGNVTNVTITGNSGQFFGNASGFNAMYMGIPSGYFIEPQMVAQVSSNFNGYAGFNLQNINNGSLASTDIFLTPNNGTIADGFFDIGVASSTYNYSGYGLLNPNDMYLIASGNVATGNGNLVVSTSNANDIVFAVQGTNVNNEVMRITRANVVAIKSTVSSSSTTTGALTVAGGVGVAGATYVGGTLSVTGQLNTSASIIPTNNNTQNIGSGSFTYATVYATTFSGVSTTAKYADLAENYLGDRFYNPGTVVMFGGSAEVTVADADTTAVAGVVSTNPAHLMNGGLTGANVVPLALQGRVPCMVIGPVKKGDLMVSAGFGYAKTNNSAGVGQVIGKSLADFPINGKGVVEVVVGRF